MPRGGSRPSTPGALILALPPDTVLDALFVQACLTRPDGEPYIEGLRRYTALLLEELQAQVFNAAHTRAYDAARRERKRKDTLQV